MLDDMSWPSVRKAARFILANRSYSVDADRSTRIEGSKPPLSQRLFHRLTGRLLATAPALFSQEAITPSWALGDPRALPCPAEGQS